MPGLLPRSARHAAPRPPAARTAARIAPQRACTASPAADLGAQRLARDAELARRRAPARRRGARARGADARLVPLQRGAQPAAAPAPAPCISGERSSRPTSRPGASTTSRRISLSQLAHVPGPGVANQQRLGRRPSAGGARRARRRTGAGSAGRAAARRRRARAAAAPRAFVLQPEQQVLAKAPLAHAASEVHVRRAEHAHVGPPRSAVSPSRWYSRCCRNRSRRTCASGDMSADLVDEKGPALGLGDVAVAGATAPVKAPCAWPNSSAANSSSEKPATLTATKGACARATARAAPAPPSPCRSPSRRRRGPAARSAPSARCAP